MGWDAPKMTAAKLMKPRPAVMFWREDVEAAGRELGAADGAEDTARRERDEARAGRIGADAARC